MVITSWNKLLREVVGSYVKKRVITLCNRLLNSVTGHNIMWLHSKLITYCFQDVHQMGQVMTCFVRPAFIWAAGN